MKITQKQFNKARKGFSKEALSDTQKNVILSNIYAEREELDNKHFSSIISSYFIFFRQKAFVAFIVVLILFSGASYASAQSLPGELLYGMKVNVIEPLGLIVRFSEEEKNEYKMLLLKKRVDELEELEKRGMINQNSQKASSKATNNNIKELENSVIFDKNNQNDYVSEKVKIYNNLIDSNLKIETTIEIDSNLEVDVKENDDESEKNNKHLDLDESYDINLDGEGEVDNQAEEDIEYNNVDNLNLNTDGEKGIETDIPEL